MKRIAPQIIILLLLNIIIAKGYWFDKNPWNGLSVSTSDNLDAISINPAGLGVDKGDQSGFYLPIKDNNITSIHSSSRFGSFGYSIFYNDEDEIFNPTDFTIGIGSKINSSLYLGATWNKYNYCNFGLLYRPFNSLSFGMTARVHENDGQEEISDSQLGLALRPFSWTRMTIGMDMRISNDKNDEIDKIFMPFLSIRPIDGISLDLSSSFDNDFKNMHQANLSLNFQFDKSGFYTKHSEFDKGETNTSMQGIGFIQNSLKIPTCLKKSSKDKMNFIRMDLGGTFIEEKPQSNFFTNLFGDTPGIQLKGWLDEINNFTENKNIDGLIINLKGVNASMSKRSEMRDALNAFKDAGKKIYVYAEYGISNADYYLTSMADEIYVGPMTGVSLRGLNMEVQFIRGLLDTLSIVPEVFRVNHDGKSYKTAGDGLLNRTMSDEMKENYTELLGDLFDIFVDGISSNKGWENEKTLNAINNGPYFDEKQALDAELITGAFYPDEFDEFVKNLNDKKNTVTTIGDIDRRDDYVYDWNVKENDKIAVIYAVGGIMSGSSDPGPQGSSIMGDKTIREAIKSAREDKSIKAVVLRIDSGGGSAIASDKMWREVLKTTETDSSNVKPFIASMSGVAASGGYYIACQADSIIAEAATITGSIGVIGIIPNLSQLMKRIGINYENIQMGDHADFGSWSGRLSNEYEKETMQNSINNFYAEFKDRVGKGRDSITEDDNIDDVALGRVFTGKRASELKLSLVDRIGGYYDAIDMAKNAAGIKGDVDIVEYPKESKMNEVKLAISAAINHKQDVRNMLPEQIADELEVFDMVPILIDDEIQYILPYKITVD